LVPVLKENGVIDPTIQLAINGVLQIINFATAVTMCFYVDKIGRRKLFMTSTIGMMATYVIWTICAGRREATGGKAASNAVVVVCSRSFGVGKFTNMDR
jgi:hypothetical protein